MRPLVYLLVTGCRLAPALLVLSGCPLCDTGA